MNPGDVIRLLFSDTGKTLCRFRPRLYAKTYVHMLATFTTDVSSGQYICIYLHPIKNILAGNKKLLCVFLFQTITKKKLVTTSSQPLFRLVFHLGFCHTATLVLAVIGRTWMFSHIHTFTHSSTWSNINQNFEVRRIKSNRHRTNVSRDPKMFYPLDSGSYLTLRNINVVGTFIYFILMMTQNRCHMTFIWSSGDGLNL